MSRNSKYCAIFRLAFIHTLRNGKALVGLSIFLITCLIIYAHLWKVAAVKIGAVHLHPNQLLWYIAFNEWVLLALPDVHEDIEEDLRSGKLAYLLPRPVSYLGSVFVDGVGVLSARLLVLGLVTFLFTWLRAGSISFGLDAFPITLGLGFLAGCIGVLFKMGVGFSAFWVHQVDPFYWIWEKLLFTLGGLMLPLAVYPTWLQTIASYTPFPAIMGDRSVLAIDFTWASALSVTCTLLFWGAFAICCLALLYRKGLRVVNIGGG